MTDKNEKLPIEIKPQNKSLIALFEKYRVILDERNDRRERIVKASRDVTSKSKKAIFALHRMNKENREETLSEGNENMRDIRGMIAKNIASEVDEETFQYFHRAFSPGLQEYVEARTLLGYLQHEDLVSLDTVREELLMACDKENSTRLEMDSMDYLLGVADLTGELMRRAIANSDEAQRIREFLYEVESAVESLNIPQSKIGKDWPGKVRVLHQSVRKVEKKCYDMAVRYAEAGDECRIGDVSALQ